MTQCSLSHKSVSTLISDRIPANLSISVQEWSPLLANLPPEAFPQPLDDSMKRALAIRGAKEVQRADAVQIEYALHVAGTLPAPLVFVLDGQVQ